MVARIGGLMVGVGTQEDPRIRALRYAARDADRLWASFADVAEETGGDASSVVKMANDSATVAALVAHLEAAAAESAHRPFDLYLMHLSSHGLPSGDVLLHDAVYDEAGYSAFSLAQLNEALVPLRARTLVVTLDICFGGTVVGLDGSANRDALHAVLEGLVGQNRAIAWAAGANEPAHESDRVRHGYLTMGLIQSLARARDAGLRDIPALRWLHEAMTIARDEALRLGRPQTPQLISRLGPDALIPVPQVGPRQMRQASVEGITPVAADLEGLTQYGFSDETVKAVRAKLVGSTGLNDLQRRAIAPAGLLAGHDVVVRAPTSAGKTLVGELAFLRVFSQGLKSVMLVPTRALASEHAQTFAQSYRHLGLRVVRSAGDVSDDDDLLFRGHFDVAVLTYEKFASLVYHDLSLVDSIALTILDEIQLIRDVERGRVTELLLALLQQRRRRGLGMQLVGLCGDFADLGGLPEWLGAELVGEVTRPVPLKECVIDPGGHMTSTWRDDRGVHEELLPLPALGVRGRPSQLHRLREVVADELIQQLMAEGKQVLVFRTSRPAARRMAKRLAGISGAARSDDLVADFDNASMRSEQSRITAVLRTCLRHGLAFHSSELEDHERTFLEDAFRHGRIKAMVATTTLAAGVNLPAHAAVIVDHAFYRGPSRPQEQLDPVDYRNMVGRAGRAGQGMAAGEAYLIAGSGAERAALSQTYLGAGRTRLSAGIGSMAVEDRTMAAAAIVRRGSLLAFVEVLTNTFWGFQQRPDAAWRERLRQETDDALEHLIVLGLLSRIDGREYTLTEAGAACAIYGVSVKSAARVLSTIERMIRGQESVGADEILTLVQLTAELDASYIPVAEGETVGEWLLRLGSWGRSKPILMHALQQELDSGAEPAALVRRVKRTALLRTWLSGRSVSEVEDAGSAAPEDPVLGYVRDVARRSGDILPAVVGLVASKQPERQSEIHGLTGKLRTALEFGVTMAAATLQRLRLGITRKQALALAEDGITTLERLQEVVDQEPDRLERRLTTPGLNDLRAALTNRTLARRRRLPVQASDDTLSLFPDGPLS